MPIYNVGKYLNECLKSIQNQTFSDFEVIMVDDGLTDDCANICKGYSGFDNRFMYF